MAKRRTPQECALQVLWVFHHHGRRPGEILRRQSFGEAFDEPDWRVRDLDDGLKLAIKTNWIIQEGGWYRLTQAGFDRASRDAR
jgi:hypothetical protein